MIIASFEAHTAGTYMVPAGVVCLYHLTLRRLLLWFCENWIEFNWIESSNFSILLVWQLACLTYEIHYYFRLSASPRHPKDALLGWDLWSPSEYRELKKPVWTDLSFVRIHTFTPTATAWSADTWQDESMISCCLCQILTPPSKCKIRDIRLVNTFPSFHYVILVSSCKL